MEPKPRQNVQRPSLRLETMVQKGPPPAMASIFGSNTSRSMNMSTSGRSRTISESAVNPTPRRIRGDPIPSQAPLNLMSTQSTPTDGGSRARSVHVTAGAEPEELPESGGSSLGEKPRLAAFSPPPFVPFFSDSSPFFLVLFFSPFHDLLIRLCSPPPHLSTSNLT
ncbi:unnamed protein product [Caenorhabditis auriculariae]|uniref:Uncharacterized protein n=1 Tax=Caenorhabditis auriculariae TaxID=2777116 RepID=A0A8S1HMK5_9PELO|nr:unnamed protein product [Caenorhabditis auriculariae]